jgi:hypothetical protein
VLIRLNYLASFLALTYHGGQHVSYMLNKISKRYYLIFELSRIGIPRHEIILIYCAIHSVLEYTCAVWNSGLTIAQSFVIEQVQKRCLRTVFPELSYSDALFISGLERLTARRERIVRDTFKDIQLSSHPLHNLLSVRPDLQFNSRNTYHMPAR